MRKVTEYGAVKTNECVHGHGHICGHGHDHFHRKLQCPMIVGSQWSVPGANWAVRSGGEAVSGQYIPDFAIVVRVSGLKSEKLTVQPC